MSEDEYYRALRIADQHVRKKQAMLDSSAAATDALGASSGLRRSSLASLQGRKFKKGDQWEVIALRSEQMRVAAMKSAPSEDGHSHGTNRPDIGVFRYTVTGVNDGLADIQVEQVQKFGIGIYDARVSSLAMKTDQQLMQHEKRYAFVSKRGEKKDIRVSPDGLRSGITGLELFPLDMPRLEMGDGKRLKKVPVLPEALQKVSSQAGFRIDASEGLWFEESDFFGRPIEIFWKTGDPWPTYMKTSYGVAILVKKGESHE